MGGNVREFLVHAFSTKEMTEGTVMTVANEDDGRGVDRTKDVRERRKSRGFDIHANVIVKK